MSKNILRKRNSPPLPSIGKLSASSCVLSRLFDYQVEHVTSSLDRESSSSKKKNFYISNVCKIDNKYYSDASAAAGTYKINMFH
jgi:hypothetical protein